jgi:hypothetical protein
MDSLSVLNVRDALDRIALEYRTGARQPSVISRALSDNEPIEKEEMLEQISQDLEEKDVHPDSISLNKPFLDEWLSKVVRGGNLEEGSLEPLPMVGKNTVRKTISSHPTSETPVMTSLAVNKPEQDHVLESAPLSLPEIQQDVGDAVVTSNDDLYADLDYITTRPDDSITVVEENFAPGEPRSRSESVLSSASKSAEWHPYDRPAPEYVLKKLRPLFHDEPTPDPSSEATKRAIMRAFHQADYSDEGFLTRRAVLQHLAVALEHSPMMPTPMAWRVLFCLSTLTVTVNSMKGSSCFSSKS